ncbi:MAG: cadherin-like beta sandwich domain-containing protein, partial [Clostridia bacterium]|nr:cadherin-like beta sandwich domain-containing protein [Clostridia bacterium]
AGKITDDLKIWIGDYIDKYDLKQKAVPVETRTTPDGNGSPIVRRYTKAELMPGTTDYVEIPVTLLLGDYTSEYKIIIHDRSNNADLNHTGDADVSDERRDLVGLGVTGYPLLRSEAELMSFKANGGTPADLGETGGDTGDQFSPYGYHYKLKDYEVTVGPTVTSAEIYAYAYHVHKNSSTLVTVFKQSDDASRLNLIDAAISDVRTPVNLTPGINKFVVRVTSEDGTTTQDYTITVNRSQTELNVERVIVNDIRAQRIGNEFVAYVANGTDLKIEAQSDSPYIVTTSVYNQYGNYITDRSGSTYVSSEKLAYAKVDGVWHRPMSDTNYDHTKFDEPPYANATLFKIHLDDNKSGADNHSQDYNLWVLPAQTQDILRIILGTPDGGFDTNNMLGFDMPITAIFEKNHTMPDGSVEDAYVARVPKALDTTRSRVVTVDGGKLVKIGTFTPQGNDFYDTTGKQFTARGAVVTPQVMNIGVTDYDGELGIETENLIFRNYLLSIETMESDALLLNADYQLEKDITDDTAWVTEFTENLDKQQSFSIAGETSKDYITFKNLILSDKATGTYVQNSRRYTSTGVFESGDAHTFELKVGINDIKIKVTSEDRTVTNTYKFSILKKDPNDKSARLNDIKIYVGDPSDPDTRYYDTVSVPAEEKTSDAYTYHYTIPQDLDLTKTPLHIEAVPFTDQDYTVVYRMVYNMPEHTDPKSYGTDEYDNVYRQGDVAILGKGAPTGSVFAQNLNEGDRVRVIFIVSSTEMASEKEYAIEFFKDHSLKTDPEFPFLSNIIRSDTGKPLTRAVASNVYDLNYYDSVDAKTHQISLNFVKNQFAMDSHIYLLSTRTDSNTYKYEERVELTNTLNFTTTLQPGDNTFLFEVSQLDDSGIDSRDHVKNTRFYSVTINKADGITDTSTGSATGQLSHNAELKSITSSNYTLLTAMFDKDVHEYFLAIPSDEDELALTVDAMNDSSTLRVRKVGGERLYSGIGSSLDTDVDQYVGGTKPGGIPLNEGSNMIVITVMAEDGITRERYVIDAYRAAADGSTGDIIDMDVEVLASTAAESEEKREHETPHWNAKLTNYFISYDYDVTTLSFKPTLRPDELGGYVHDSLTNTDVYKESYINISHSGSSALPMAYKSGETFTLTDLPYGDTEVLFDVNLYNGTRKRYIVTVNRAYDAVRPELTLPIDIYPTATGVEATKYAWSKGFYHTEHAYYLNVDSDTSKVWVRSTLESGSTDLLRINNAPVSSGDLTEIALNRGDNVVNVTVSDTQGSKERYLVVINRAEAGVRLQPVTDIAALTESDKNLILDNIKVTYKDATGNTAALIPDFDPNQYD